MGSRRQHLAEGSGIGLVRIRGIVVRNLNGYWRDPTLILYQSAPLKIVFFVQVLKKIALPCGASRKFGIKSCSCAEHPGNFE